MDQKAVIFGCGTTTLSDDEIAFFRDHRPWGFILFSRNIDNPDQVRRLCDDLRATIDIPNAPILIDQEGGRVQRLRPPHWHDYPTAYSIGKHYGEYPIEACRAIWIMSRLHAFDLLDLGINVDCLPLLDLRLPQTHEVIGDRAYAESPDHVIALGLAACNGLKDGGVVPVVKHVPGHGRATADSHLELPRVQTSHAELSNTDFKPFVALADQPMAMTAHIIYESLDSTEPATTSVSIVSDIIRGEIGFDNLLMSDDVSMKALKGDFATRTKAIFHAGCDVVLHCNGDMPEMIDIAANTPILAGKSLDRAFNALAGTARFADKSDEELLRKELTNLTQNFAGKR